MQCLNNLLLNTDSYKASHWLQYPPGTDATFFYVESRGGTYDRTVFFGLQAILKEYLANLERGLIQQALDDSGGVVARAAEKLKTRRTTLVEKMRKYGMLRAGMEQDE